MFHIIVNPKGGKGKSIKSLAVVEDILKRNKIEYTVHRTKEAEDATEITRQISAVPDSKLLVLGGDGSYNSVLNGIENFENVTIGFVPCGTGNDFIAASKHPKKVKKAMEVILKGNEQYIDFIQLEDRRCLNILGAGMDVDVLLKYAEMKPFHGKVKYYASLIYTLIHTKWHKLRLTIDGGEPMERSTFMIGIGNGRSIGGGMPICPNGVVDDGKLDIVIVNEMKRALIPFRLLGFLTGKHVKKSYTEEYEGKSVKIEILDDSQFEADGEVFASPLINCHVVSNKLKVFR